MPVLQRSPEDSLYPVIPLTLYMKAAELEGSSTRTSRGAESVAGEKWWRPSRPAAARVTSNKLLCFPADLQTSCSVSLGVLENSRTRLPRRNPRLLSEHLHLHLGDFHLHHLHLTPLSKRCSVLLVHPLDSSSSSPLAKRDDIKPLFRLAPLTVAVKKNFCLCRVFRSTRLTRSAFVQLTHTNTAEIKQ